MAAVSTSLRRRRRRTALIAIAAAVAMAMTTRMLAGAPPVQPPPRQPARIVSLIPATTEMLFAMGAGSRLVAVSQYDTYPPEVATLPRAGGLLDPNVERILSLMPDLVIVYDTQVDLRTQLERAGIPMFRYTHRGLPDITQTMRELGARIGMAAGAEAAARRIEQQLDAVRQRVAGLPRPKTLLVIGREPRTLSRISASAGYGFLHDLLEIAGGIDVLGDARRQSMEISVETILARAPEVIIELHYGESLAGLDLERERRVWDTLAAVPAVRRNRVHLLVGNEFVVPGPRIVRAAERFAAVLHP